MKTRYIYTAIAMVILATSCIKEEQAATISGNEGYLKVRLTVPEIEVKASSTPSFYAFVPSELQNGTFNPIGQFGTNKGGDIFFYDIPEDADEVVFTPLCGDESEVFDISADDEGNVLFAVDTTVTGGSCLFDGDILAGYVGNIVPGTKDPYDVEVKRLSSKLTTNFRIKNDSGTNLNTRYIISSVEVEYSGFGDSVYLSDDETVSAFGNHSEQLSLKADSSYDNYLYYNSTDFIPTQTVPSVTVTITRQSGIKQIYTKSLGQQLEPNRHYTVNLIVTHINSGGPFVVYDPEVTVSSPVTPTVTEKDFFTVPNGLTLAGDVGSELLVSVSTILPYEWTFELDEEAGQYFTVEKMDGKLKVIVKEENSGDIRYGNVTLKSITGDYTKTFALRQFSTRKHEVVMTYESSDSYRDIYITGENITVQDPNDGSPRFYKTANATAVRLDGLYNGATVTITGDVLKELLAVYSRQSGTSNYKSEYQLHDGYYYYLNSSYDAYHFEFKNCRYLETFIGNPRNASLDFSQMPELKTIVLGCYSSFSTISFAEGQGVEYLRLYRCGSIQQLDLRNISETLSTVKLNDCDVLLGANFKNFKNLKSVDVDGCNKMGSINLTGCTDLESFSLADNSAASLNVTDCSSLKRLSWSTSLQTLIHDGADAIEYVDGGYVSDFNFSGKTSLKTINGLGASNFDVSDCSNLESMGHIYNVMTLNVSNCTALKTLDIDFIDSSGETYSFDNCPSVENVYFKNMGAPCDFSPLENLKKIQFDELTGMAITTIDLGSNALLETVSIDGYSYYLSGYGSKYPKLSNIILSNSVRYLNLYDLEKLIKLDLSNHTNLLNVCIENCYSLNDMNFSGCTQLKTLALDDVAYYKNGQTFASLNLSGCSSLEYINKYASDSKTDLKYLRDLNVEGCSSLAHVNIYNASVQTLDFSDCPKMIYLDARNNDLTREAIDAMFVSLPDWSVDDGFTTGGYMLSGNYGFDIAAANAKNWWSIE